MKENSYETSLIFNSNDLICCSCSCKCSGINNKKIRCVHKCVSFSHLFMDRQAEHGLLEVAALWDNKFPYFNENAQQKLFEDISNLVIVVDGKKCKNTVTCQRI